MDYLYRSGLKKAIQVSAEMVLRQGPQNGPTVNPMHSFIDSSDLHAILVGTGTPMVVENRSGPCTAIAGGGHLFLVDTGPGTYKSCVLMGLPVSRITAVLISHFHSDHIGDLGEVMTFSWIGGRKNVLPVMGPRGVEQVVEGFRMAYERDRGYRVDHHMPMLSGDSHGFQATTFPAPPCKTASVVIFHDEVSGMKVSAFEVDHTPVTPAFGFRFELNGRVIVVSGDTCKCDSLQENCKGADVVVQEAICCEVMLASHEVNAQVGNPFQSKIAKDVTTYHTSVQDCVEIASQAQVPMMLLTHLVPAPDNVLSSYFYLKGGSIRPAGYSGRIVIGEDGMVVRVGPPPPPSPRSPHASSSPTSSSRSSVTLVSGGRRVRPSTERMSSVIILFLSALLVVLLWRGLGADLQPEGTVVSISGVLCGGWCLLKSNRDHIRELAPDTNFIGLACLIVSIVQVVFIYFLL